MPHDPHESPCPAPTLLNVRIGCVRPHRIQDCLWNLRGNHWCLTIPSPIDIDLPQNVHSIRASAASEYIRMYRIQKEYRINMICVHIGHLCRSVKKIGCPKIYWFQHNFVLVDTAIYRVYTIVRLPHISVTKGASQWKVGNRHLISQKIYIDCPGLYAHIYIYAIYAPCLEYSTKTTCPLALSKCSSYLHR